MPCMPSLFQPGRRGGGGRWCPTLARIRRKSKQRSVLPSRDSSQPPDPSPIPDPNAPTRDKIPKVTPRRPHAWEPQPQVLHRLRTTNAEATPASAARAFIARACRRASPAAPAEAPSASRQSRQGKNGEGGAGREGERMVGNEGRGEEDGQKEVADASIAASVALPSFFQAFSADPTAAATGAPSVGMERSDGKDEEGEEKHEEDVDTLEVVDIEGMKNGEEEEKVAKVGVAASAVLPSIFQAFNAAPAAPAAPAAVTGAPSTSIQQRDEKDGEGEADREKKEEAEDDEAVGVEGMGKGEEEQEMAGMEASSARASAAHAWMVQAIPGVASAAAAANGAPSTSIERESQQDGEREENREGGGRGEMVVAAGIKSVASPGDVEESYGSLVPAEFRPKDHKDDVLRTWGFDDFDKTAGETLLGSGAFGSVYSVLTKTGKRIAKKVMSTHNPTEEEWATREVEILRVCCIHPAIVGLHGYIRTPTEMHMLMPEAPFSLAHLIKESRLTEKQAGLVVRKMVSALEFMHRRDVVHRDIKPANVLVRESEIYLADFGLAVTAPDEIQSRGNECGTLQYMAPEFFEGQAYGAGVDVWALGVVLYEVLHGKLPFTEERDVQSKDGGGGGSAIGLGGGSGNVSESSGSIVTGCSESNENIKWNIVKGNYEMDESLVGANCRGLISKLLSRDPSERLTAVQAGDHPWFGKKSTSQRIRRTARLVVATNTATRAMGDAQHLQARVQPSSEIGGAAAAAAAVAGSSAVLQKTAAAKSAVAELGQMVMMLTQVVAMGKEVTGWERKAAAAGAEEDVQTAVSKAEEIVRTVEMFAGQAEPTVVKAKAVVDSWEEVVRRHALP